VASILWPDANEERARHSLSQTIYNLRRDLGRDVVLAAADLRLNLAEITTDLEDFRQAIAAKDWSRAAALYAGPFLHGFVLSEPGDFERWAEEEGAAVARDGLVAVEGAAREASTAGRVAEAVGLWERATKLDPLNSRLALGLVESLALRGDRTQALAHAKAHTELLERELEAPPDPSFVQAVARLREGAIRPIPPPPPEASPSRPQPVEEQEPASPPAPPARFGTRGLAVAVATAVVVAGALIASVLIRGSPKPDGPAVLAVGRLRDLAAPDSARLAGVLSEMLATSLGRLTDLEVIGTSRLLELMPADADPSGQARLEAARRAGAREVLEGEITQPSAGVFRFDLRRMDLASGVVRRGYSVTAGERYALIDSATRVLAADLRIPAPPTSLGDVSTRSPLAYRLYEEGLRAFYQLDNQAAHRLFTESLAEDSTFAMAAYYSWYSGVLAGLPNSEALAQIALDRSDRALDRDRLIIRSHILSQYRDPRATAAGDSLRIRYPNDPEALIRSVVEAGAPVASDSAVALIERAIAIDSAAGSQTVCRLCEAFRLLVTTYGWADSFPAAERTTRRWIALRPEDGSAWVTLAQTLYAMGRVAEGDRAMQRAAQLTRSTSDSAVGRIVRGLSIGESDGVLDACLTSLESGTADRGQIRWYCVLVLRNLGRYRDGLALVHDGRVPGANRRVSFEQADPWTAAILDLDMDRGGLAGQAFLRLADEVIAGPNASRFESLRASDRAWRLALAATAIITARDKYAVIQLGDSVQALGAQSLYLGDQRLHHFVRGLVLGYEGDREGALTAYRRAISSWPHGYTRINYEIAKTALALKRPQEAIYPLQAALRGGLEGPQIYITRTELHELLGRAFEEAGRPDSAAGHYRKVVEWWSGGDPHYAARAAAARAWLARRGAGGP
jgi:DNA-binding SARP family transcriptional activator